MPLESHLKILKKGANAWGEWRQNNPNEKPILINADLSGADLSGANLSEADLIRADLIRANLSGAKLENADLQYANLTNVALHRSSLISANFSNADISGAGIDNINMSGWTIKGIICTHVFLNEKRIDYYDGEFERRYTKIEKIIEMIINVPLSDLTHYTGRIIQEYVNEKYGEGSLVLKGQTALSNDSTRYDFLVFRDEEILDEIHNKLSEIEKKINPVYEDMMAKQENREVITFPDKLGRKVVPLEVNTKAINNVLNERFNKLSPILQKFIIAIQAAFH